MKKALAAVFVVSVFVPTSFSYAQDHEEAPQPPQGEFRSFDEPADPHAGHGGAPGEEGGGMMDRMKKKMKDKGMMGGGGMMDHTKLVATSDGGVVVLQGPKLTKYDSGLNLVGQAELAPAGPKPGSKRAEKGPQGASGPDPMSDEEVAAVLGQDLPEGA